MTYRQTIAAKWAAGSVRSFAVVVVVMVVATLGLASALSSAQTPPISGFISDDTAGGAPCVGDIRSDEAHCDLRITVTNHTPSSTQFTVDEVGTNGAFDTSTITPGTSTLADCPCVFTLSGNQSRHYRLRIKPTRSAITAGYFTSQIKLYAGSGASGRQLHTHRISLKYIPDPTVITVGATTDTTIDITWTADRLATSYVILYWQVGNRTDAKSAVARSKAHSFSGLLPQTAYWIQVQPTSVSVQFPRHQIKATTSPATTYVNPCKTPTGGDYDSDDDGLIEICSLKQLDAIRHDLNGDGVPDVAPKPPPVSDSFTWGTLTHYDSHDFWYTNSDGVNRYRTVRYHRGDHSDSERVSQYKAAFPTAASGMGCPSTGCQGYELMADLDFDPDGDGFSASDPYGSGGKGWVPIMGKTYDWQSRRGFYRFYTGSTHVHSDVPFNLAKMFTATFEGNGHTIANLYINRPSTYYVGLFGYLGTGGAIRNVGLIAPYIRGGSNVGALAGIIERARISGSFARAADVVGGSVVGALLGTAWRENVFVTESYATGRVHGTANVGGLIGFLNPYVSVNDVSLHYTFASVDVSCHGTCEQTGGLVGGVVASHVQSSYATGRVERSGPSRWNRYGHMAGLLGGLQSLRYRSDKHAFKIANSYTTSTVWTNAPDTRSGLISWCLNVPWKDQNWQSYWKTDMNTGLASTCRHETMNIQEKTLDDLKAPTSTNKGIYGTWSDNAWDFGTSTQMPILAYCGPKPGIDLAWDTTRTEYCPLREATQWGRTLGKR